MLHLIPTPQKVRLTDGSFSPRPPICVLIPDEGEPGLKRILFDLATELRSSALQPVYVTNQKEKSVIKPILLGSSSSETYRLTIKPSKIEISSKGTAGLFYGVQTLRQLVRQFGHRLPCCTIEDEPAFRHRGVSLDVSRGRVPRLQTLCQWADLFAFLKINEIQLYVEHAFAFSFDPSISHGCDVLTPHELRYFAEYCRARHILLIPSLACFGHMGRILSLPQYRDLAEVPWPAPDWKHSRWIQRLRGATLDPRHRRTRWLIKKLLEEFLPLFSAPYFNMCGDETYDLGKGRNLNWVLRNGMAALYARHVQALHAEARRHGKRLMLWGDVLLKHPEAIRMLPKDSIVLDWGYEPDTDFQKALRFIEVGLSTYVCPSTRGYRVVFNQVEMARANITEYAQTGFKLGADGFLNTDWGDMGHFNLPAASLHGWALGAAVAWHPTADAESNFDRAFALQLFGDRSGKVANAFRQAGTTGTAQWPLLLTDVPRNLTVSRTIAKSAVNAAESALAVFQESAEREVPPILPAMALSELSLACRALALTAAKILLFGYGASPAAKRRRFFADELQAFFEEYAGIWRKGYKPLALEELRRAFAKGIARVLGKGPPLTPNDLP